MTELPLGVLVATLGGLAIGIERQWSGHASGPNARFGGIRTFALLGGTAGLAGSLWSAHVEALAIVLLAQEELLSSKSVVVERAVASALSSAA